MTKLFWLIVFCIIAGIIFTNSTRAATPYPFTIYPVGNTCIVVAEGGGGAIAVTAVPMDAIGPYCIPN